MGLDMHLSKKTYVKNWDSMEKDEIHSILIKKGGIVRDDIDPKRVKEIVEEVGYWRKANAIHGWFVDNVQEGEDDCKEHYVDESEMEELLRLVNEVLANRKKASELLPVRSGFFFGNYDEDKGYDEWYFESLENTKEILEEALENGGSHYYRSSW